MYSLARMATLPKSTCPRFKATLITWGSTWRERARRGEGGKVVNVGAAQQGTMGDLLSRALAFVMRHEVPCDNVGTAIQQRGAHRIEEGGVVPTR